MVCSQLNSSAFDEKSYSRSARSQFLEACSDLTPTQTTFIARSCSATEVSGLTVYVVRVGFAAVEELNFLRLFRSALFALFPLSSQRVISRVFQKVQTLKIDSVEIWQFCERASAGPASISQEPLCCFSLSPLLHATMRAINLERRSTSASYTRSYSSSTSTSRSSSRIHQLHHPLRRGRILPHRPAQPGQLERSQ